MKAMNVLLVCALLLFDSRGALASDQLNCARILTGDYNGSGPIVEIMTLKSEIAAMLGHLYVEPEMALFKASK